VEGDVGQEWPLTIAVLALGGQGGGVLVDWIVGLAESNGFIAQSTSVAGVAQRTGATIYYLELVPRSVLPADGRQPVLAQMPVPGEVDIVIASELMEAGRAVQRGFVSPGRTTVIASSHRTYSTDEKVVPGNGIADSGAVLQGVRAKARRLICDDMAALAVQHGSVISASLFGALAGSGALPFDQAAFEETVRRAGVGVDASLRALRAAAEVARREPAAAQEDTMVTVAAALPVRAASGAVQPLVDRVRRQFPEAAWPMLGAGLARVIEYQDLAYGSEYLDRVACLLESERSADGGDRGYPITVEAARQVAVAMAYDDVVRVADLKIRAERHQRIRGELGAAAGDVVHTEEYFHPRLQEVVSMMPVRLGQWLERSPRAGAWLSRRVDRGRRVRTDTVRGQLQLGFVAGLRRWRRGTLRHVREQAHLASWLEAVRQACASDPALALEIVRCRQLVKGYSDTHARGSSRFDQLMTAARALSGRRDAAGTLASLRDAAFKDASGQALQARWRALELPGSP